MFSNLLSKELYLYLQSLFYLEFESEFYTTQVGGLNLVEKRVLVVNIEKCTGCKVCMLACSFTKEGVFSLTKSRIWILRDEGRSLFVPIVCEHCEDAPCQTVCPVGAIYRDQEKGIVLIDESRCIGCRECMWICPFGAVQINLEKRVAVKCDLCNGDPECVKVCIPGALQYVSAKRPAAARGWERALKRSKALELEVG